MLGHIMEHSVGSILRRVVPFCLCCLMVLVTAGAGSGAAQEVNLSLVAHSAIPTASDSLDDNYNHLAGAFADGKKETAWVTGPDMREHWAHIEWRHITVTVNRVEIDFSPLRIAYSPPKKFDEAEAPPAINLTTARPESLELEVRTQGRWQTIQGFAAPLKWINENTVSVTPERPLIQVSELRLKLRNRKPDDFFAVREICVLGAQDRNELLHAPEVEGPLDMGRAGAADGQFRAGQALLQEDLRGQGPRRSPPGAPHVCGPRQGPRLSERDRGRAHGASGPGYAAGDGPQGTGPLAVQAGQKSSGYRRRGRGRGRPARCPGGIVAGEEGRDFRDDLHRAQDVPRQFL